MKEKGFTLTELIIVIAILAILAGISLPLYSSYISKAEDSATKENAHNAMIRYWGEIDLSGEYIADFIYVETADRIVAIQDGAVLPQIYETESSAIKAIADDPVTTEDESLTYHAVATAIEKLYAVTKVQGNSWEGATAHFVGDSITAGTGTSKKYFEYINELLGFQAVSSSGIPGSCISAKSDYGTSNTPLIDRYQSIPSVDLIVVFMGTNDYGHETPLGTIQDTADISFYGALNVIIPGIQQQHPNSQLIFVTPLHRYGFGTSKLTGNKFTYDSVPNGRGHTLADYVNAIKTVCAKYAVPVIDLFNMCPIDPANASDKAAYFPDGLHPNEAGHEIVASILAAQLQCYPKKTPGTTDSQIPESTQVLMQHGNKFASDYASNTTRISSVINIYLKAGQTVTLKDAGRYQWALAKTAGQNTTNNAGYHPGPGWSSVSSYTVEADGYYGVVLIKNDGQAFDFASGADSQNLYDYITIE